MKLQPATNKSWPAQVLWGLVVSVAVFAVAMAAARLVFFSYEKLAILATASFVSVLAGRYRPEIPYIRFRFSIKNVFALLGVLLMGVSGGLLLTAVSSLRTAMVSRAKKDGSIYEMAVDVISIYAGSTVFYLALGFLPHAQGDLVAGDVGFSIPLLNAALLMAATCYLVGGTLRYLIHRFRGTVRINSLLVEQFAFPLVGYGASFLIAIAFYFAFFRFGTEFGIVLVPVAVLGDLAYRIYQTSLAVKTRQISDASRIHLATVEALATAMMHAGGNQVDPGERLERERAPEQLHPVGDDRRVAAPAAV